MATCIYLYDFDFDAVNLREWFSWCVQWFEKKNIQLIHNSITANDIKSKKKTKFKYGTRLLEKRDFKNVESIMIDSDSPSENPNSIQEESVASIGNDGFGKPDMTFLANQKVFPFEETELKKTLIPLIQMVKPRYGFVHLRDYEQGPTFYTWGIIMGLDDENPEEAYEEKKIGKWNLAYCIRDKVYRTGHLREIYPLNLLCPIHLAEQVHGTSLEAWVRSSPDHGTLEPLMEGMWAWWVPEDKRAPITEALKDTGLILCV